MMSRMRSRRPRTMKNVALLLALAVCLNCYLVVEHAQGAQLTRYFFDGTLILLLGSVWLVWRNLQRIRLAGAWNQESAFRVVARRWIFFAPLVSFALPYRALSAERVFEDSALIVTAGWSGSLAMFLLVAAALFTALWAHDSTPAQR